MKRLLFLLLAALVPPVPARAQQIPDDLIIAGGGSTGKWDTEIEIANSSASAASIVLSIRGLPLGVPCPPNCTSKSYAIPGHGTIRVLASDFIGAIYPGPQMIRVESDGGAPLPVVHARVVSSASASQFAELPVSRESSLRALDASTLVFPGVSRDSGVYSNLILESIGTDSRATEVLLELFDSQGNLLGSGQVTVTGEATFQAMTLVDVARLLGVSTLDDGQIRVTKLSGEGVLWGVLATIFPEGFLKVSVGANP